MFDAEKLKNDLERDESFRAVVYDDHDGKPIVPGSAVRGHPTVGIGWALDTDPISHERARIILGWQIDDTTQDLFAVLPWARDLDENRCRALVNMTFNLGAHGVLGFHNMLEALRTGRWADAAAEARSSVWFGQVGDRAKRIADTFETGAG